MASYARTAALSALCLFVLVGAGATPLSAGAAAPRGAKKRLRTLTISQGRNAIRNDAEQGCAPGVGSDPCLLIAMGTCERGASRLKVDCDYTKYRESGSCRLATTATRTRKHGIKVTITTPYACDKKPTDVSLP
jgi:hypothetical protein